MNKLPKYVLSGLVVSNLVACATLNTLTQNIMSEPQELTVEQQNDKIMELRKNFPNDISFWKSCEEFNKSPDRLLNDNKEIGNQVNQAFNDVAIECKKFGARFGNGNTIRSDCNTCTSKEAGLCAKASRNYIKLLNTPYFESKMTYLQFINSADFTEKAMDTQFKMTELCSGKQLPENTKIEAINKGKQVDNKLFELKQTLKKQYEVAEQTKNADNCGIMPCHFIKQAAESTPKAKEI